MLSCSFCGKKADRTRILLSGPDVNICDACIAVGVRTIEINDALEDVSETTDPVTAAADDVLLSQMAATSELADKQHARLQAQVEEVRRRGVGWRVIGASLGLSEQVAEARFAR